MTTACTTTTSPTVTRSLRLTLPETGRGQASLWTAAAAPDHKLWTTLRGPVDPSRLPTCPLHYDGGVLQPRINHINQRRDDLRQPPVAESALADIDRP
jgi:hypothetical protein